MNQIELAKSIATKAHSGQFRHDGKTPYIEHPKAVVAWLERANRSELEIAVAWLHDVLEDCDWKACDLLEAGVSCEIVDCVSALTKLEGMGYDEYLTKLRKCNVCSIVKIADMICNLNDNPSRRQIRRYGQGLAFLVVP